MDDVKKGRMLARRYRNRRIGEFLKELDFTEGRGTGIPKMRRSLEVNGSPEVIFNPDEARTYFDTIIQIHPNFIQKLATSGVQEGVQEGVQAEIKVSEMERKILLVVQKKSLGMAEILEKLGYKSRNRNVRTALKQALEKNLVEYTAPDTPSSKHQQYRITKLGLNCLSIRPS